MDREGACGSFPNNGQGIGPAALRAEPHRLAQRQAERGRVRFNGPVEFATIRRVCYSKQTGMRMECQLRCCCPVDVEQARPVFCDILMR